MPRPRLKVEKVREILRLFSKGASKREISRILNISRPVVSEYLSKYEKSGLRYEEITGLEDDVLIEILTGDSNSMPEKKLQLQEGFPDLAKELKRPGVTLRLLWKEYRDRVESGYSYSQFCYHYQVWKSGFDVCMHQEMKAGDKLFIDYAGNKMSVTDRETGKIREVEVFVSILGASQLIYAEASYYQKQEDVIRSAENCLHYLGGVPKAIVPDCMKTAVIKADKYEPEINPVFLDFARHYDTVIYPARPGSPQDKALVENAVRIIYRKVYAPLRDRTFYSIEELNAAIKKQLEEINSAPMQRLKISRQELFLEIERGHLSPLPQEKYMIRNIVNVTVQPNYHVYLSEDKHYYSVPYRLKGNKIRLYYTDTCVEAYHHNGRVAIHKRDRTPGGYTTNREHMPSAHKFYSEWNPEKITKMADGIGRQVKEIVTRIMDKSQYPEQAFKKCIGIIGLSRKYDKDRLCKACHKAIYYNTLSYQFIKNLLLNRKEDMEEQEPLLPNILHENIRGSSYFN